VSVALLEDSPVVRAERLLRDVLGEDRYRELRTAGYLDLPSKRVRGRVYRLDSLGNLSYRDAGETGFNTTLCVQPEELIPRDDQVAMRYLLVTADEERLLEVANPIAFGFISLARTLFHDFRHKYPVWLSALFTAALISAFPLSLALEVWTLVALRTSHPVVAVPLSIALIVPALLGLVLLGAGVAEAVRAVRTTVARRRLVDG
jgi:hypothetical protein